MCVFSKYIFKLDLYLYYIGMFLYHYAELFLSITLVFLLFLSFIRAIFL